MDRRVIGAIFDDATIRVYQAYPAGIALAPIRWKRKRG